LCLTGLFPRVLFGVSNLVGYLAIFCFKETEAEVSGCVVLTQQLEQSQINATDAYLRYDPTHGYEKNPWYSSSGWSACQWDTAEKQFGIGAIPGVYAPPECDPSIPYNFYNKRP
jgi:hypothetical protein